jgi:hypothetical protein
LAKFTPTFTYAIGAYVTVLYEVRLLYTQVAVYFYHFFPFLAGVCDCLNV